ncbi:unnamed protein product [Heterosigma akashiwo]|mmetsp:Transcript_1556/g.2231  ORF Transcript_1556/g.2231 Transcript_1556/m.2231 type:complete len:127 (-) Transcript_1556:314-694(-)
MGAVNEKAAEEAARIEKEMLEEIPYKQIALMPPAMPANEINQALLIFILNILLPGVGTIFCGIKRELQKIIVIGIIQLIASFLLIGWLWSVWWGFFVWKETRVLKKAEDEKLKLDGSKKGSIFGLL